MRQTTTLAAAAALSLFAANAMADELSFANFRGVTPFLIAMIATLLLIILFPQIALLIPNSMFGQM